LSRSGPANCSEWVGEVAKGQAASSASLAWGENPKRRVGTPGLYGAAGITGNRGKPLKTAGNSRKIKYLRGRQILRAACFGTVKRAEARAPSPYGAHLDTSNLRERGCVVSLGSAFCRVAGSRGKPLKTVGNCRKIKYLRGLKVLRAACFGTVKRAEARAPSPYGAQFDTSNLMAHGRVVSPPRLEREPKTPGGDTRPTGAAGVAGNRGKGLKTAGNSRKIKHLRGLKVLRAACFWIVKRAEARASSPYGAQLDTSNSGTWVRCWPWLRVLEGGRK